MDILLVKHVFDWRVLLGCVVAILFFFLQLFGFKTRWVGLVLKNVEFY